MIKTIGLLLCIGAGLLLAVYVQATALPETRDPRNCEFAFPETMDPRTCEFTGEADPCPSFIPTIEFGETTETVDMEVQQAGGTSTREIMPDPGSGYSPSP